MTAPLPRQSAAEDDSPPSAELALINDQTGRSFLASYEDRPVPDVGVDGLVRYLTANSAPDALVQSARDQQRTATRLT